jgi:hypothetical protein
MPPYKLQQSTVGLFLGELLLDEEGSEVRQLPCAGNSQHSELDQDPADDTVVGELGLISELGLTLLLGALRQWTVDGGYELGRLTRWKTCSLRMSVRRMFRSLTRLVKS